MTSDANQSAYEEDENLDVPNRRSSVSRYSSRRKGERADKHLRHQDGYSTTEAAGGFKNESDFEYDTGRSKLYKASGDPTDVGAANEYKPPMKPFATTNINEEESKEGNS